MPKTIRFAPSLVALLLGCSALGSTAEAGWFSSDSKPAAPAAAKNDKAASPALPVTGLDESIRQAQTLRLNGNYPEAINHLSQLMLVAADDPRVISEYGKVLVSMGRADEAEKFLTRAQELQPDDWTVYSALGVAYDETGDQKTAQINYERALALRPGEPSVLNNYALSRMLAKDPAMARKLADRAETANAAKDDMIARNIAMIRSVAPQANDGLAVNTPAPPPAAVIAPHVAVATAPLAPIQHPQTAAPAAKPAAAPATASSAAPRAVASNAAAQARPHTAQPLNQAAHGVVTQPVPVDPKAAAAGPKAEAATHAPRSLQPNAPAGSDASAKAVAAADGSKPAAEPAKPSSPAQSLEARAEAIAKTLNKPGAIAQAKSDASKNLQAKSEPARALAPAAVQAKTDASKALQAKTEPAKPAAPAAKVSLAMKPADVKPNAGQPAPKVLAPTPVKAADAKPQDGKTAAKPKDAIPGLRLSANAY